jgi:predicted TPR repeat methyltransferase
MPKERFQRKVDEAKQAVIENDHERAIRTFSEVLEADPVNYEAMHFLGLITFETGDPETGLEMVKRSVELCPNAPAFHYNLGFLLMSLKQGPAAAADFHRAIELQPDHVQAHYGLSSLFLKSGRPAEAEVWSRKLVELEPDAPWAYSTLALVLRQLGKPEEAAEVYKRILEVAPDDPAAAHMLHAVSGDELAIASPDYVSGLFDAYADNFDDHLIHHLHYEGPDLLRQALERIELEGKGEWRVMDLGCGTGLCGERVKALSSHLIGIDISERMLDGARKRDIYDELIRRDLTAALEGERQTLDLIVAADTLVYIGDLSDTFAACGTALKDRGLIAITLEAFGGDRYMLRPTGRFAHSPSYIEDLARRHGFSVLIHERFVLRTEAARPIAGLLYILGKGDWKPDIAAREIVIDRADIQESFDKAQLQHQAGYLQEAALLYDKIIEIDPDHTEALHYRGVVAFQTGELESGRELMEQSVRMAPENAFYHNNLALLYRQMGNLDEALLSLRKAVALDQGFIEALTNLANLLREREDYEEAELHYKKVLESCPTLAQAHNNLAVVLDRRSRPEEALEHYHRAVNLDPEFFEPVWNLANFFMKRQQYEEAAEWFGRCAKLDPQNNDVQDSLRAAREATCPSG